MSLPLLHSTLSLAIPWEYFTLLLESYRPRQAASGRTATMKLMHMQGRTPVAKETQSVSDHYHGNLHPKTVEGSLQGAKSQKAPLYCGLKKCDAQERACARERERERESKLDDIRGAELTALGGSRGAGVVLKNGPPVQTATAIRRK
ncbi:unnamed protein product [Pleuronectes platessa]|uniref:Uncharacterized protein n=1 Tax=Pleuronectes platessa TaxID=8262 RepID=A0A9N7TK08_PLEPL|nr:unnamed protein product [Pleuronectes platessa]